MREKNSATIRNMKIAQAILPVAGLGTRFLPWTKTVPKEMLPLGNQPIIAKIVDECIDAGIRDICFVISKGKEVIPQYFAKDLHLANELKKRGKSDLLQTMQKYDDIKFHVVYQENQLGDGHAILQARDWVKGDSVAVAFGDDLFIGDKSGMSQLIEAYDSLSAGERGAVLALEEIDESETSRYGIADVECESAKNPRLKKLKDLVEKPLPENAPSRLGIVGRYIIPKSTFAALEKSGSGHGGEIRLIDALSMQIGSIPVHGLVCEGERLDTGTPEGYSKAVRLVS